MPTETIYLNKKRLEILAFVKGENNSKKVAFLLDEYENRLGEQ